MKFHEFEKRVSVNDLGDVTILNRGDNNISGKELSEFIINAVKEKSITSILLEHKSELEKEIEYAKKHEQQHGHQEVWLKFISDILAGLKTKRGNWI